MEQTKSVFLDPNHSAWVPNKPSLSIFSVDSANVVSTGEENLLGKQSIFFSKHLRLTCRENRQSCFFSSRKGVRLLCSECVCQCPGVGNLISAQQLQELRPTVRGDWITGQTVSEWTDEVLSWEWVSRKTNKRLEFFLSPIYIHCSPCLMLSFDLARRPHVTAMNCFYG